ncbi:MAG: S-methyl-5-thioribose-1-phosphate isomerase [Anaerolineales bacterium]
MRTVRWDEIGPVVVMIDQRRLPGALVELRLQTADEVSEAIRTMAVRGAPAVGVSAAFGLALAAAISSAQDSKTLLEELRQTAADLRQARPTAVNLAWALDRLLQTAEAFAESDAGTLQESVVAAARELAEEDVRVNRRIAAYGAELITDGDTVLHHCNTGALAAVDYGTALGVIRYAHELGKRVHVLVDETRPRLQGSRLTAWELEQYGIPYDIITDSAAGYFIQRGLVNSCFVGADRVALNGDVANKIGTYMLALAAHADDLPFYCVLPLSTFDPAIETGDAITIEERDPAEVLDLEQNGQPIAPAGASARNPAFDITPHHLITAFVTEIGILRPPYTDSVPAAIRKAGS